MAKIIAFWGAPNSGSTTLCAAFGRMFAKSGKETVIVACDTTKPTIPVVLPSSIQHKDTSGKTVTRSVGKVLSRVEFSENDILEQLVPVPSTAHLAMIGYAYGENDETYAAPTEYDVYEFYAKLAAMTDYILIDCAHDLSNRLTAVGMDNADLIIRVGGCRYDDMVYFASNLALCPTHTPLEDHVVVFPMVQPTDSVEDVTPFFSVVDYTLDYSKYIAEMKLRGTLMIDAFPVGYMKIVKQIGKEMRLFG